MLVSFLMLILPSASNANISKINLYIMDPGELINDCVYKNNISKELLTEAIFVSLNILIDSDIIYNEIQQPSSDGARQIGFDMANLLMNFIDNLKVYEEEALFFIDFPDNKSVDNNIRNESEVSLEAISR